MAEGGHFVTKVVILIASGLIVGACVYRLINLVTADKQDSDKEKIFSLVTIVAGLALGGMAFFGALVENACLSYITLGACILSVVLFGADLVNCLVSDSGTCSTERYIYLGCVLAILCALTFAVWSFIQSMK